MKTFAKFILGAAMLTGTAFATTSPAAAQVSFQLQFGNPGYGYGSYYAPPPRWRNDCDPRYRSYRPCSSYWYNPVFYRGAWHNGPFQVRVISGTRHFWINNGWRRDEWRGGQRQRPGWNRPGNGYGPRW